MPTDSKEQPASSRDVAPTLQECLSRDFHRNNKPIPAPTNDELWQQFTNAAIALDRAESLRAVGYPTLHVVDADDVPLSKLFQVATNIYNDAVRELLYRGFTEPQIEQRRKAALESPATSVEPVEKESRPITKGRSYQRLVDEMKIIRQQVVSSGSSIAQVQQEHPDFMAWKVRNQLDQESRDHFNRPGMWEPVVSYADSISAKTGTDTPSTIRQYRKAANHSARKARKAR